MTEDDFSEVTIQNEHTEPVLCIFCEKETVPTAQWKCTNCGVLCFHGQGLAPCPKCKKVRPATRTGYVYTKVRCDCHFTDEDRARQAKEIQKRLDAEKREDDYRKSLEDAKKRRIEGAGHAATCWERKQRSCEVLLIRPRFGYCEVCPKFKKTPEPRTSSPTSDRGYRPPLRDVPMHDIDFPGTG